MDTEYATLLEVEMEGLLAAAQSSPKDLMQRLKDLGVAKMGARQRLVRVVQDRLPTSAGMEPASLRKLLYTKGLKARRHAWFCVSSRAVKCEA